MLDFTIDVHYLCSLNINLKIDYYGTYGKNFYTFSSKEQNGRKAVLQLNSSIVSDKHNSRIFKFKSRHYFRFEQGSVCK